MKRYFLFLVVLVFIASGCGKDAPRSVPSFADFYEGDVLQTLASRDIESLKWEDFDKVSIVVSEDGSRYTLIQDGEQIGKGDIAWSYNNGVHTVEFVDDAGDATDELRFTFVRNDNDHIITEVQWGQDHKEWVLVAGEDNIKGLVVDQEGVPLLAATVLINSDAGKVGEVVTDDYGYFGVNQELSGYEHVAEVNQLLVYLEGYVDQNKRVTPGGKYFIAMPEGKSGLNHGKVYGYITNANTDKPLVGMDITVTYGSGNDVVHTNSQGYYEVLIPFSEESFSVFTAGYEEENGSFSFENSSRVQVDFTLQPTGSSVSGKVKDINSLGLADADIILKNKEGVIIDRNSSNGDGTFSFQYVFDGVYQISISKPAFQFVPKYQMVAVTGADVFDIPFIGMADGKTGIGGRVLNQDDSSPVEGVVVTLGNLSATSDANGYYIMEVEDNGNQMVTLEKDGFRTRYEEIFIVDKQLSYENFTIAPPSSGISSTLYGYVYDTATNDPLVGAHVVESSGVEAYSDQNGRYSMEIKVYNEQGPQYIKVTCDQSDFATFSEFFNFTPLENTPHNIYMEPL
jgi:hypothetical protein